MKGLKGTIEVVEGPEEFIPIPEFKPEALKTVEGILNILKKEDGTPLVTKEQANTLSNLKFKDTNEYILTMEGIYFLYEVVNMLNNEQMGYTGTLNFLSVDWIKILGKNNIRNKMIFQNPLLEQAKEKMLFNLEIYRNKIDVEKGAVDCKKCSGSETISVEKQTRAADNLLLLW